MTTTTRILISAALTITPGCITAAERDEYREVLCEYECEYAALCEFGSSWRNVDCSQYCGVVPLGRSRECVDAEIALLQCAMTLQCEPYGVGRHCSRESEQYERLCGEQLDPVPILEHHTLALREDWPLKTSDWGGGLGGYPLLFEQGEGMVYVPLHDAPHDFSVWIALTSDATGTFDLGAAPNDALETCEQCVIAFSEHEERYFFPTAGSITIESEGSPIAGSGVTISLSGVKLTEHNMHADRPMGFASTLTLSDATLRRDPVPSEWTCEPERWQDWRVPLDGVAVRNCDCGCGVSDIDCDADATIDACYDCSGCYGDVQLDDCSELVDPADLTRCQ